MRTKAIILAAGVGLGLAGCSSLPGLGDILPGGGSDEVEAEVDYVDTRGREIVATSRGGEQVRVRYDDATVVYYQDRQYRPEALERGDLIRFEVESGNGGWYTDRVDVVQSVQDRGGATGLADFEGTVGAIDRDRGRFQLTDRSGRSWTVSLPYNPARADEEAFRQLRRGDVVRIRAEAVGTDELRLERFY